MKRDYLTILEVAESLGVSRRQAYELVHREIPHYKVSRKDIRVPKVEFERWRKRTTKIRKP